MGKLLREPESVDNFESDRRVYFMTDTGEEIFNEMIHDFPSKLAASQSEFLVQVALFERLEHDMQNEILQKRQELLQEKLKFYRHIENTHSQNPFVIEVICFQKAQIEHELAWIAELKQKR
jgi:DNA-binding PadR family transcriptional regulator